MWSAPPPPNLNYIPKDVVVLIIISYLHFKDFKLQCTSTYMSAFN